jgi:rare lipoprotein A
LVEGLRWRVAGAALLAVAAACVSWAGEAPAPAAAPVEAAARPHGLRGLASWYGHRFHGRLTASGARFDMHALTAAHPTLPFNTRVLVRNLITDRSVEVRITDRGPHLRQRVIDLSQAAARAIGLGLAGAGVAQVELTVLGPDGNAATAERPPLIEAGGN